jgi:general secretion pathway protein L
MATILGLDVGPDVVRGVVLKTALRRSQVVEYLVEPVEGPPLAALREAKRASEPPPPADGEEATEAADHEEAAEEALPPAVPPDATPLAAALRRMLRRVGVPVDRVYVAMPGESVSVRRVALPAQAARKVDELLPFELEALVPFDPVESVIHHQPIGTYEGELQLLAAVAPFDRVRDFLEGLAAGGVDPREVGVGAVALDGLTAFLDVLSTPGPHLVLDVEDRRTDICILEEGRCHFARTLSVGAGSIDQGKGDRFAREVKQTVAAWRSAGGRDPATFALTGALATRPGSSEWLSELLDRPIDALPLPEALGVDAEERPGFARALALAGRALTRERRIDLRQGELAPGRAGAALRQQLPLLVTCAAAVLLAFLFASYTRYSYLSARHDQLAEELAEATAAHLGSRITDPSLVAAAIRRGLPDDDPMPEFDAYDALTAISAAIPDDIPHDVRQLQIDLGDGEETARFSLRGSVSSIEESERIVRALEDHRVLRTEGEREVRLQCFRDLELGGTSRAAEDRRAYRLEGDINCLPEGQEPEEEDDGRQGRRSRRRR